MTVEGPTAVVRSVFVEVVLVESVGVEAVFVG
jgi:hypothetical protein